MSEKNIKSYRLNPLMILMWVIVAIISAVVTWLVMMTEDAQIYSTQPSSFIPEPSQNGGSTEINTQTPPLSQGKLTINLDPEAKKMGVIVTHLGLQADLTEHALANLPAYTTVSFSPYTHDKKALFQKALAHAHEVIIDIPMTLKNGETCDGGPCAVEASLSSDENYRKMRRILTRTPGCIGLNCFSEDESAEQLIKAILPHFKSDPFLLVAHVKSSDHLPATLINPIAFQENASEEMLLQQLSVAENTLTTDKSQILIGKATPRLIETLQKWGQTLQEKHIQLIPLSTHIAQ